MLNYIIRRLLYAVPIVIGVNLITFGLFFGVTSTDQMARQILGDKHRKQEQIDQWKEERGYDKPPWWNSQASGFGKVTDTIFFQKNVSLMWFDLGLSDRDRSSIGDEVRRRMVPSLMVAVPLFLGALFASIIMAMFVARHRNTYLDLMALVLCVVMMSVSELFYIIGGQYLVAKQWHLFPISGWGVGLDSLRFTTMPFLIGICARLGMDVRFFRTVFLEEVNRDYVRTARSKGLSENRILFTHVLSNAMMPILTSVVLTLPFLFLGSLLLENFFMIPGLGSYTIDAIEAKDFAVVRAMVFISSLLYIGGTLLTDISYTLVDPRIRLE
jgi:peptide/nickel transport system permease protein